MWYMQRRLLWYNNKLQLYVLFGLRYLPITFCISKFFQPHWYGDHRMSVVLVQVPVMLILMAAVVEMHAVGVNANGTIHLMTAWVLFQIANGSGMKNWIITKQLVGHVCIILILLPSIEPIYYCIYPTFFRQITIRTTGCRWYLSQSHIFLPWGLLLL